MSLRFAVSHLPTYSPVLSAGIGWWGLRLLAVGYAISMNGREVTLERVLRRARRAWWQLFVPLSGRSIPGRLMARIAVFFSPPYKARSVLAQVSPKGFISPWATVYHRDLRLGRHVYIGDRVIVYQSKEGGPIELDDRVKLYSDAVLETGKGGRIRIGPRTAVHRGSQLVAHHSDIIIGEGVEIAQDCAFYPFNHGITRGVPVSRQPLRSRGPIVVGNDVWLGVGVTVLDGVSIGDGAIIGAGSVVTTDIPPDAIAAGVPAHVVRFRTAGVEPADLEPLATGEPSRPA